MAYYKVRIDVWCDCRDVGVDCDFVARGETVENILRQCAEHARSAHDMTEIPPELADKVRAAIRDEAGGSIQTVFLSTWGEVGSENLLTLQSLLRKHFAY
jgi:predicted small metal-binding protein